MLKALSTYITKFFALAFLIGNGVQAQNEQNKSMDFEFSTENLRGTTWQMIGTDAKPYVIEFTKNKIIHYFDGALIGSSDYYLSDEPTKNFEKKKLGRNTSGKYIISRSNRNIDSVGQIDVITKLNNRFLTLEIEENKKVIGSDKAKFKRIQN
ncbi:MAG: hypothetical protein ACK5M7_16280 [Draconibacterium sp.]